jgi:hypothetical protein
MFVLEELESVCLRQDAPYLYPFIVSYWLVSSHSLRWHMERDRGNLHAHSHVLRPREHLFGFRSSLLDVLHIAFLPLNV